ncbi:MAG: neutral zinc metallopeptidase, partial [Rhizobiales bacterium]|nr:neutral zinc metallopeptidase [Hyphomicrobiales bacterium]
MRWEDFRRSDNVEDARGEDGGFGGGIGLPGGGGGLGIGTIVILGLIGWALGIDPRLLIGGAEVLSGGGPRVEQRVPQQMPGRTGASSDQSGQFVAAVLGNTEDTWQAIFQQGGQQYRAPRLRLFTGATQGACGFAQAAMGPFYCPQDKRIYLDTSFFDQIERRFRGCSGKACKFSQAYVIAHEVGHHVQNLLGTLPKAQQAQQQVGRGPQAHRIQVQVELQADCFAGVWAHHSEQRKSFLDPGDVDAALQT